MFTIRHEKLQEIIITQVVPEGLANEVTGGKEKLNL